jgi:hypothetical protein
MPQAAAGFPAWKYTMDCYTAQQLAMVNLSKAVLDALDDISIALIRGDAELENIPLPTIIDRLVAAYAVASPSDMAANHALLLSFFNPPSSMPAHLLRHVNAHYFAARNLQPYSVSAKVQMLRASIVSCGLFATTMMIYDAVHPTIALQTWDSLSQALTLAAASLVVSSSASQGFALAAPAAPALSALEHLEAENKALRLALAANTGGQRSGGRSGSGRAVPTSAQHPTGANLAFPRGPPSLSPKPAPSLGLFCWSHTSQGHIGTGCTNPLPGHQPQATWQNRMASPCH